jgi:hypothetical protein
MAKKKEKLNGIDQVEYAKLLRKIEKLIDTFLEDKKKLTQKTAQKTTQKNKEKG